MSLLKTAEYNYKANQTSIAPKFDPQSSYTIGDLVMKGGDLYKFTASHLAGPWDESEVEVANVSTEFLKSESSWIDITNEFSPNDRYPNDYSYEGYIKFLLNKTYKLLYVDCDFGKDSLFHNTSWEQLTSQYLFTYQANLFHPLYYNTIGQNTFGKVGDVIGSRRSQSTVLAYNVALRVLEFNNVGYVYFSNSTGSKAYPGGQDIIPNLDNYGISGTGIFAVNL